MMSSWCPAPKKRTLSFRTKTGRHDHSATLRRLARLSQRPKWKKGYFINAIFQRMNKTCTDSVGAMNRERQPSHAIRRISTHLTFGFSQHALVEALTGLFDSTTADELQLVFQSWIRKLD
jgi:hypothetical protein